MTLRARTALIAAVALAAVMASVAMLVYLATRSELRAQLDATLRAGAAELVEQGMVARAGRPRGGPADGPQAARGSPGVSTILLGPRGELASVRGFLQFVNADAASGAAPIFPVDARARRVAQGEERAFFDETTVAGVHLRVYTERLKPGVAIQVARPLTEIDSALVRLRRVLLLAGGAAVALAAAFALLLAQTILRPVTRATGLAERIAGSGALTGERMPEVRRDELGRLARSFNRMLDALRASVDAQRQLVADASHELRTPLTSALTNLEVLGSERLPPAERRSLIAKTTDQLRELSTLVGNLIELARGTIPPRDAGPHRLDALVGRVVERSRPHHPNVALELEAEPTLVVGDGKALERAISNLIDNAANWSPTGGVVRVLVRRGEVVVEDEGPGIADEELSRVFDRFYRSPAARSLPGSGLGLAIVREIAEAHHGSVRAERGETGARLRLTLPAS